MRRRTFLPIGFILITSLACNTLMPRPTPTATIPPSLTPNPPTSAPTPTSPLTPTPASKLDLSITTGDVIIHPDSEIYAGDKVSIEVFPQDGAHLGLNNFPVALYWGKPGQATALGTERAGHYGLGSRLEATFTWAWDTTGLVGPQTLTVVLDPNDEIHQGDENPDNNSLTFTVDVRPRAQLASSEQTVHWLTLQNECCIFHYMAGSAAERDIQAVEATANAALRYVENKMGRTMSRKMEFNLINRLLGHGGFASDTITITHIDRDYAGGGLENVFRHEATHLLDRQFGLQRPALIEEGTATYVAGGHFKEEPFEPRMVGLLALNRYIPLKQLADGFYSSQHEIGYLEGAAFISYLVDSYGWDKYKTLLSAFQSAPTESAMLDGGLQLIYDKSLSEVENDWLAHLRVQAVDERWKEDIAYTVSYLDTVRRYQQADDPSAYFLNAWIPDISKAVRNNITADYSRHPHAATNIALETMLMEASRTLDEGNFTVTQRYLEAINVVLDAKGDFGASPLAADYLALTTATLRAGYEPQRIELVADTALVSASHPDDPAALIDLTLKRVEGSWRFNVN